VIQTILFWILGIITFGFAADWLEQLLRKKWWTIVRFLRPQWLETHPIRGLNWEIYPEPGLIPFKVNVFMPDGEWMVQHWGATNECIMHKVIINFSRREEFPITIQFIGRLDGKT